jgi:hypothetical protein
MSDRKAEDTVGDIAGCSRSTVKNIIGADTSDFTDGRGHETGRKIAVDKEEELKSISINALKEAMEIGKPVSSKDFRILLMEF